MQTDSQIIKHELVSVIDSNPLSSILFESVEREYKKFYGSEIPFGKLGFASLKQLISEVCEDCLQFELVNGQLYVTVIGQSGSVQHSTHYEKVKKNIDSAATRNSTKQKKHSNNGVANFTNSLNNNHQNNQYNHNINQNQFSSQQQPRKSLSNNKSINSPSSSFSSQLKLNNNYSNNHFITRRNLNKIREVFNDATPRVRLADFERVYLERHGCALRYRELNFASLTALVTFLRHIKFLCVQNEEGENNENDDVNTCWLSMHAENNAKLEGILADLAAILCKCTGFTEQQLKRALIGQLAQRSTGNMNDCSGVDDDATSAIAAGAAALQKMLRQTGFAEFSNFLYFAAHCQPLNKHTQNSSHSFSSRSSYSSPHHSSPSSSLASQPAFRINICGNLICPVWRGNAAEFRTAQLPLINRELYPSGAARWQSSVQIVHVERPDLFWFCADDTELARPVREEFHRQIQISENNRGGSDDEGIIENPETEGETALLSNVSSGVCCLARLNHEWFRTEILSVSGGHEDPSSLVQVQLIDAAPPSATKLLSSCSSSDKNSRNKSVGSNLLNLRHTIALPTDQLRNLPHNLHNVGPLACRATLAFCTPIATTTNDMNDDTINMIVGGGGDERVNGAKTNLNKKRATYATAPSWSEAATDRFKQIIVESSTVNAYFVSQEDGIFDVHLTSDYNELCRGGIIYQLVAEKLCCLFAPPFN